MAFTRINTSSKFEAGASTTIASDATSLTAGNLIDLVVRSAAVAVSSIADTAGNTYTLVRLVPSNAGSTEFSVYECQNCLGHASNVVTVTFTGSASARGLLTAQYSTPASYTRVLAIGNSIQTTATAATVSLGVIEDVDEALCLQGISIDNTGTTWTAGSGWTKAVEDASTVQMLQERFVTSATDVDFTVTNSANNQKQSVGVLYLDAAAGAIGGFDPSGGGGGAAQLVEGGLVS